LATVAAQTSTSAVEVLFPVQFGGTAASHPPDTSTIPAGGAMVAVLRAVVAANTDAEAIARNIHRSQTMLWRKIFGNKVDCMTGETFLKA
jgi:uncharacterized membrane protein